MTAATQGSVAVVGVAYSEVKRHSERTIGQLAVSATDRALADAGLERADIDGISLYPVPGGPTSGATYDGVDYVSVEYLSQALGLENLTWSLAPANGTIAASLVGAVHALASGSCTHALVVRAMHNPKGAFGRVTQPEVTGDAQFTAPWGFGHQVIRFSMPYSRYMARYGATREHLATFIARNRANAAENPDAVFFGQPLSVEDYLGTRMIAEPLSLVDCDMPVDGAGAIVLTTADRARDLRRPPAFVHGAATLGLPPRRSLGLTLEDMMTSARRLARSLWASASVSREDITHAHVYDGFSYFPYLWLEAFGFFPEGEAYVGLQDDTTSRTGKLPLNTSGGALGMGRLHGSPQVVEAVLQIQGRAGARQIANADVALVQVGGPTLHCGALVLTTDE
jgi:acetyl-CoA acetyltransferase